MDIKFKPVAEKYYVPIKAHKNDAAFDLQSNDNYILAPFERKLVSTGIAIEIPEGYCGLVLPRSGLAIKYGITVLNAPGLIDSNYRGEIKEILINLDPQNSFEIKEGDRIAQLLIAKTRDVEFVYSDILEDSERGAAGFGSSGISG